MNVRLVLFLALALTTPVLAGCVGSSDEPLDEGKNDGKTPGSTTDPKYPEPIARTPLATAVAGSAEWVKPGEAVTFTAQAPEGAEGDVTYAWSYGPLPDGSAEMMDTGDVAAGASAEPMLFEAEGEYLFHCHPHPFMKMTITVREGAEKSGVQHVAILDGDATEEFRFAPEELEIAPGTSIVFWNNGTMMHTATQEDYKPLTRPIAGEGASITFTPSADGDFRVVVIVKDAATGYGKAETRLLVDSAKPDAVKTFDAKKGSFQVAAAGNSPTAANKFSYMLDYNATKLTVKFTATSAAPDPQIAVELTGPDGAIATADPAATGEIVVENLPAGQYSVVVTPHQGLAVEYEVVVTAELELVPPPPGASDGHGGHHH